MSGTGGDEGETIESSSAIEQNSALDLFKSKDFERKSSKRAVQIDFIHSETITKNCHIEMEAPGGGLITSNAFEKLQDERRRLPIYLHRESLLDAVSENPIIIVAGDAGVGKSTQIPQYLHEAGYTALGKIASIQPRQVATLSVSRRVSQEMGVHLGDLVGYSCLFDDRTSALSIIKFLTADVFIREMLDESVLSAYSVIIVDEVQEKLMWNDLIIALLKGVATLRPDLKIVILTSKHEGFDISGFLNFAPVFLIPGIRFPFEINYAAAPVNDYLQTAIVASIQIHLAPFRGDGDILVFLPSESDFSDAKTIFRNQIKIHGTEITQPILCLVRANLPLCMQATILKPTPKGARRIVFCTDEFDSNRLENIRFVVDPGFVQRKVYNHKTRMTSFDVIPVSRSLAFERAVNCSQVAGGQVFRLYTSNWFHKLSDSLDSEIRHGDLTKLSLYILNMGFSNVLLFDFLEKPSKSSVDKSLHLLKNLGAVDVNDNLTEVGKQLAVFPLDVMSSKMILASEKYACSEEAICVAAMLNVARDVFIRPKGKDVLAVDAHKDFQVENVGDHISLLKVYNSWRAANFTKKWCVDNLIKYKCMETARVIRDHLEILLNKLGIVLTSNADSPDAIRKAIASGFFVNCARLTKKGTYATMKEDKNVNLCPGTFLATWKVPRWVIFHEAFETTKAFIWQVSEIKPELLLEVAPHFYKPEELEDSSNKKVPRGKGLSSTPEKRRGANGN